MLRTLLIVIAMAAVAKGAVVENRAAKITELDSAPAPSSPIQNAAIKIEQKLSTLLMQSSERMTTNPTNSIACFNEYVPKLNNLTNEYEHDYNGCLARSDERLAALESDMTTSRNFLTSVTEASCNAYVYCNKIVKAIDFFNCYADVANKTTKTTYEIEKTSTANVAYISHVYENARYERESCCDAASTKYVEESATIYAALEECLAQVSKVP